jgi:acetyl-CoA/propionyl-CoA carboxylase carboxyl transferase subunit
MVLVSANAPTDAPPAHDLTHQRLDVLFDRGTMRVIADDDQCVRVARGSIDGTRAIAYATEPTRRGGAIGVESCDAIVAAIDQAVREWVPVIGLWDSGGARIDQGVAALDGVGSVFAAIVRASGRIPQISVVLGPAAGGAAYGSALTDVVIMSAAGRIFVTGPDVVRDVTGENVDMRRLGGPEPHGRRSGVVHVVADDELGALSAARTIGGLLGRPGRLDLSAVVDVDLTPYAVAASPANRGARQLVDDLLDAPGTELQARWAPNVMTVLGRLGGRTVGVVANNPARLGGCLDAAGADKAARFVRTCDGLGVPLVVLVDVPGNLPGVRQESDGVARRAAKLVHAFAEAVVPRVTLITRKAHGSASIAFNSRSLGATAVFAWPDAEIGPLGAPATVDVLHRETLAKALPERRQRLRDDLIREHRANGGGLVRALEVGIVDEVISPARTRSRIAQTIAGMPVVRGGHTNIPL